MDLAHWMLIVGCAVSVFLLMRSMQQIRVLVAQMVQLRQALGHAQGAAREAEDGRVRLMREAPERQRDAQREVLVPLLELDDHLLRATAHSAKSLEGVREGLELLGRELEQTWQRLGLQRIAPQPGEPFDVKLHEAVAAVPHAEAEEPEVEQLLGAGFMLDEHLLRPARVVVRHSDVVVSSDTIIPPDDVDDELEAGAGALDGASSKA